MTANLATLGGVLRALPRKALQMGQLAVNSLGWTKDVPVGGPLYMQVSISDPCNHRCVMCAFHPPAEQDDRLGQFGGTLPGLMPRDEFTALVDELRALGTRQIDLVGRGEPLLHPHAADMVAYAKDRGFTVTMTTNGSRLDEATARKLVEARLDRLRISLNAGSAETYPRIHVNQTPEAFRAIRENVRTLCRLRTEHHGGPYVTLAYVVGALNFAELVAMVEAAHELGADAAHFQHNFHMNGTDDLALSDAQYERLTSELIPAALGRAEALGVETDLAALRSTPATYRFQGSDEAMPPCYIGHFFTVVLGNGNVMACCQTQKSVGSIRDGGFTNVWRGDAYREFRRAARRLPDRSPELDSYECDRCFFRTHNVTLHNTLHPFARIPPAQGESAIPITDFISLSRLRKSRREPPTE
jgi:MoaA/NifB/PqqE/SkfB family radical SAM enzyme